MKQITNEIIMKASEQAIASFREQGCHVYGSLADAIYSQLWEAVNEVGPRWDADGE